jgi:dihydroflavonol-4-reductase
MNYIITGAGGHVGNTLIRMLQKKKVNIYGLIHKNKKYMIKGDNIHYVIGDVTRMETLEPIFQKCAKDDTVVVHCAGIITLQEKMNDNVYLTNVEGTINIVNLCKKYKVKKLVYVRTTRSIPVKPNGKVMTEPKKYDTELVPGAYAKSKTEAIQYIISRKNSGVNSSIVLPSAIIGPYDNGSSYLVQMAKSRIKGKLNFAVKGGYDFVDVRDVAEGIIDAVNKGQPQESYILSGTYCSIEDMLNKIGELCKRKPVKIVPLGLAKFGAGIVEFFSKIFYKRAIFTKYSLKTVDENSNFSNEKAKKELGYTVRPLDDTIKDMVKYLSQNN